MISKKQCSEEGCEYPVWSKDKCKYHQMKKPSLTKKRGSFGKQKVRGDGLTMKEFFQEIWDEREHVCFETGEYLGEEPNTTFFAHILNKSSYPEYAFEKWNVQLAKTNIHAMFDAAKYDRTPKLKKYLDKCKTIIKIN